MEKSFCQSCDMPMTKPEDFGAEADGILSRNYCRHCYVNGALRKNVTMGELTADVQELADIENDHPGLLSRPLLDYIGTWLALEDDHAKTVAIPALHAALMDGQDCDFTGTQWEQEWLADGKVCHCVACIAARKCVSDIRLMDTLYKTHYYTIHKSCPCDIGEEACRRAAEIYKATADVPSFAAEMERQRVIGRTIWYDEGENTIFIAKTYACDSGGGCPENKTLIGQRCHCDHYNHSKEITPKYYCKCGAEFYRPMFAPLFGDTILIEPYKTVLAGDEECIIAVRIGKAEENV